MNEFYERITAEMAESVLIPWKEECASAPYPWRATESLKDFWQEELIGKGDLVQKTTGFIALSHCSNLSVEEMNELQKVFKEIATDLPGADRIVHILLTGASPHLLLFPSFFMGFLQSPDLPPSPFWILFSQFVRHPFISKIAQDLATLNSRVPGLSHWLAANPAIPSSAIPIEYPHSTWFRGLSHLKCPAADFASIEPRTILEQLGVVLRCDVEFSVVQEVYRRGPSHDFHATFLAVNPSATFGPAPAYDPIDPSRDAIEYFSQAGVTCSMHRYNNPLLTEPWEVEGVVQHAADPLIYLGVSFLGRPVLDVHGHELFEVREWKPFIEKHPTFILADRYLEVNDHCSS